MYQTYLFLLLATTSVRAGALLDSLFSFVPAECQSACTSYLNSTAPCIEDAGNIGLTYDPKLGGTSVQANKLSIYFCACSSGAIEKSVTCLDCVSAKWCLVPSLTSVNYNDVCNGQQSPNALFSSVSRTC